jgi:c-di-GMP-binding flagellar brake protein YcgR
MTNPTTNPSDTALEAVIDSHQYSIASRLEISQILRAIMRNAGLITASVDGGGDFFLTSIVRVDNEAGYLMLECERHGEYVERVLGKQHLLCSTTLDKIKIQFVCEGIELAVCDGRDAFKARLPQELLRLQRREYFRMATPIAKPVKCTLSLPDSDVRASVELSLIDISCGGLAALTPQEIFVPELGACYDCVLHLPGTAALRTQVQARNAYMMKLPSGKITQRSGFAFVNLRESMLSTIQRYIMGLERQRNTRLVSV